MDFSPLVHTQRSKESALHYIVNMQTKQITSWVNLCLIVSRVFSNPLLLGNCVWFDISCLDESRQFAIDRVRPTMPHEPAHPPPSGMVFPNRPPSVVRIDTPVGVDWERGG